MISAATLRALGVTRVARVTGLDRTGVEVACAVRPLGHVLQVCQGKGESWERAAQSAVGEAAELAATERPKAEELVFGSALELGRRCEVWLPDDVSAATSPALAGPEVIQGWVRAKSEAKEVLLPASAIYCPPAGAPWIGPATSVWTSNGLGAGPTLARARRHALFEVLEREGLHRALPEGWTPAEVRRRLLEWEAPLRARLLAAGFPTFALDVTPRGYPAPVVAALLFDAEGGPVPVTAGYACRATPAEAAKAAVLEAAQSRVTEIHGAREDVVLGRREEGLELYEALARARPRRRLSDLPRVGARVRLPRGARLAQVVLARAPWAVVRVFVRRFRTSELL